MCIALLSTAHPSYSLIIIDNRDEYLRRPTSPADWWPVPASNIIGGRDLARAPHGTWMGVTKEGKVAVLTNYRENTSEQAIGAKSRGAIVCSWLDAPSDPKQSTRDFVQGMVASPDARNVGGFSLLCGYLNEPLAIVSNRSSTMDQIAWVATDQGQTLGLSNTVFDDRSWPKILHGERLMNEAIAAHVKTGEDEDALIARFLDMLSTNTLPKLSEDATAEDYLPHFRKSIFIPVLGAREKPVKPADTVVPVCVDSQTTNGTAAEQHHGMDLSFLHGAYGTQKQTVLLVSDNGRVRYFERTLYDGDANAIPIGQGDRSLEFQVSQGRE
ncbi:DUF833-domain-containing protein [Aspergillus sclerotioniger CBS 115572]|uniref:DUF833-domain-containing protein n=1 Tax=Aspergillus sclerotioniger CBS 115572 TaxID=1450535 RepID=A0A317VGZ3_9EURO|nr:DUF833-domain-containing protein [Aspergillus sclerotioniger CBS 115572]PWY71130.1 DUF833-domain-containing protein [Aspergillus sclerotioniger CBS 115572]